MEISSTSRQPDWQSPLSSVPPVRYHNPIPEDDIASLSAPQTVSSESSLEEDQKPQGRTIREIRLSISQGQARAQRYSPPTATMPEGLLPSPQAHLKKKSSIFGGLFAVKEPTQVALNQVAAQLVAQHGSVSATRVPNVSMEKMPQHVPKVNSKWDGVPNAVKQREKREKELARAAKRQSMTSSTIRSHSSERVGRQSGSRHSDRTALSEDSKDRVAYPTQRTHESRDPNPHRFYAQSVNSSGDLAAQLRPENASRPSSASSTPPSTKTSSSKSVAEGGVFPDDISSHKAKAHRRNYSVKRSGGHSNNLTVDGSVHGVPKQAIAPIPKKIDSAKAQQEDTQGKVSLLSSGPNVLPLPTVIEPKLPIKSNAAFLAGEAQEFQPPDDEMPGPSSVPGASSRPPIARRITPDDRPASANDSHNAQLRPKDTLSKRFGTFLKR